MLNREKALELLDNAVQAREKAYAPYSDFYVGAALLCADGEIFYGANIENASYGCAVCAARNAIFSAVLSGKRDFSAIAIVGAPKGKEPNEACLPCGVCRQVTSEFCNPDFEIIVKDGTGYKSYTMAEILPHSFSADMLN